MPTTRPTLVDRLRSAALLAGVTGAAALGAGCGGGSSGSLATFAAQVCNPDAGSCKSAGVESNGCASIKSGQKYCSLCTSSTASPCSYCPSDEMCPSGPCGTECTAKTNATGGSTTGGSTTGGSGGVPAGITCYGSAACGQASSCPSGSGSCTYSACACSTSCGTAGWYAASDGQTFVYGTCGNLDQVSTAAQAVLHHCGCF